MNDAYKNQVKLLLDVLPEVAKERCLAMHGGTAINLFVRDMPRLSVDIDLTYIEIGERQQSLTNINAALAQIKKRIEGIRNSANVIHKPDICKLQVSDQGAMIKIEVNMVGRGLIEDSTQLQLCETAQEAFDAFCVMPVVSLGQLYGGKICAALDRQHPRDLFDVRLLLDNEGLNESIKKGFIYGLSCSNRPTHELLSPNLIDQSAAFANQFEGMTTHAFSYEDYEQTRQDLVSAIQGMLSNQDKAFLLSFNRLLPDWSIYDFQEFPSVKWKLQNLAKLHDSNKPKYLEQLDALEAVIG